MAQTLPAASPSRSAHSAAQSSPLANLSSFSFSRVAVVFLILTTHIGWWWSTTDSDKRRGEDDRQRWSMMGKWRSKCAMISGNLVGEGRHWHRSVEWWSAMVDDRQSSTDDGSRWAADTSLE
ncbi:hypothetical protein Droror1_Dr00000148, partial [Drosera rotundifolia]